MTPYQPGGGVPRTAAPAGGSGDPGAAADPGDAGGRIPGDGAGRRPDPG